VEAVPAADAGGLVLSVCWLPAGLTDAAKWGRLAPLLSLLIYKSL